MKAKRAQAIVSNNVVDGSKVNIKSEVKRQYKIVTSSGDVCLAPYSIQSQGQSLKDKISRIKSDDTAFAFHVAEYPNFLEGMRLWHSDKVL